MTESGASVAEAGWLGRFERIRRPLSWLSVTIFGLSFVALLGLSATSFWTPENSWVAVLDRAWRISGFAALVLWLIPRVGRAGDWVGQLFSR